MSELSIGKKLQELAQVYAAAEPSAPPLEGLAALLELGQLAQGDPDAAGFALAGLLDAEAETLLRWAESERREELTFLRSQLTAVLAHLDLLELPPLLADDPDAAEAGHAQALAALHTRERIHQLGVAATWLRQDERADGAANTDLADADRDLQTILPHLAVLAAERARMAGEIAGEDPQAHWWWTAASPEAPEPAGDADAAEVAPLQRWVAERIVASPSGNRLQLAPDEVAALLATPRGQRLAAFLGDRLEFDFALAAPVAQLGTVAEALAAAAAPIQPQRRFAPVVELWRPRAESRPERLAAATDSDPVLTGLDALAGVFCKAAELLPGLGVVAHGTRAFEGGQQRVWLFLPEIGVAELQIGGVGAKWSKERWSPGGLAVAADNLSEPFDVTVRQDKEADAAETQHWLETGPADLEANRLTRLLRHVYGEQVAAARLDWAELLAQSDADDLQALSGLRLALATLYGGEEA
jgi:hypothetical protein